LSCFAAERRIRPSPKAQLRPRTSSRAFLLRLDAIEDVEQTPEPASSPCISS
jgi:hypothetical protein